MEDFNPEAENLHYARGTKLLQNPEAENQHYIRGTQLTAFPIKNLEKLKHRGNIGSRTFEALMIIRAIIDANGKAQLAYLFIGSLCLHSLKIKKIKCSTVALIEVVGEKVILIWKS